MTDKTDVRRTDSSRSLEFWGIVLLDVIILPAIIIGVLGAYALGVWIHDAYFGY